MAFVHLLGATHSGIRLGVPWRKGAAGERRGPELEAERLARGIGVQGLSQRVVQEGPWTAGMAWLQESPVPLSPPGRVDL